MQTVSVIIPVYNTEEFIDICLNSLYDQSYKNLEIIIINDGSNEACTQHLKQSAERDDRIKLLSLKENKGVGYARNLGVKNATGDYIYFLDSDDYIPSETLSLLVKYIDDNDIIRGRIIKTYLSSSFIVLFDGLYKPKTYTDKRYNLIKNNTVLNTLFRKEFVLENNFTFSENVQHYSDLQFIVPAFMKTEQVRYLKEAVYFSRKRNDPISNPSLSQCSDENKIENFLQMYHELKMKYTEETVNNYLDQQLLNFYRKKIINYSKGHKVDLLFKKISDAVKRINPRLILNYDRILKREIAALKSGKLKKYKRVLGFHNLLRDVRNSRGKNKKLILYRLIFSKLPMNKNLIFFESFLGKNYSDSPKYIYEYLLEQNSKYKFVWCFNEKTEIPGNAKQVKRFSLSYFYYLARAKYWVSNSRLPKYLDKREGNIYLQTWHGTPLKKLVFDMDDIYSADPKYKENFYSQSRRWDFLSSPNEYSSRIFRRAFKFDKKMLEYGYPRNDILYKKNNKKDIDKLKEKMNIPKDKKVVLYAPTWRDDDYFSKGKYNFELQLNLEDMQKKLGGDYIVLLRMHYFIANKINLSPFTGFAYDFSSYDDIAELYLVSDILITDYSSVFFDYANLKRPILFYTYDLEKYRNQLRGFYLNIEKDLPGPLLYTSDEVIDAIIRIDQVEEEYKDRYDDFYNKFCMWDDGRATERTVKAVFKN